MRFYVMIEGRRKYCRLYSKACSSVPLQPNGIHSRFDVLKYCGNRFHLGKNKDRIFTPNDVYMDAGSPHLLIAWIAGFLFAIMFSFEVALGIAFACAGISIIIHRKKEIIAKRFNNDFIPEHHLK